jgi:enoyl-CoA hydratase
MVFTCEAVTAQQLFEWGTVYRLTEPEELMDVAMDTARTIAKKQKRVISAAKQALNNIDIYRMAEHYRLEQGFTYELNLHGDGDEARDAFIRGDRTITR